MAGSLAGFFGLFGFMAHQLRAGRDPVLGNAAAAQPAPAKRVVIKRIERRVIVTRLLPPKPAPVARGGAVRSVAAAPSGTTAPVRAAVVRSVPAPVTVRAPAPAPAPAAPAPAPAPAPTPAPIVTRSS
jgi:hypothetical protein